MFAIVGFVVIAIVLLDALETIVLPRTVKRNLRLATVYFALLSKGFVAIGNLKPSPRRNQILVAFAPVSLIFLIVLWAVSLVFAFGLIGFGLQLRMVAHGALSLSDYLYFSGVTFFTLGFGDLAPATTPGRFFAVAEAGTGLGFLALLIGYVPVVYQTVARREVAMLLLDSKAGSNPSAFELIRRHAEADAFVELVELLKDWERTSAELLESMLSFPFTAFYRSQHDEWSWLRSLTCVLDASALMIACAPEDASWAKELRFQAKATFAMARHAVVDIEYILGAPPNTSVERLTPPQLAAIRSQFGVCLALTPANLDHLAELRRMYEPNVLGLAHLMIVDLPEWAPRESTPDNWETSAWDAPAHF